MVLNKYIKPIVLLAASLYSIMASAQEVYTIKFATLIPADTAWMKELDTWTQQITAKSQGRLVFKIYPGGVMGDEPDVLRKMRSQQLQGAFFTGYGVGRIYSPARVVEMPFFFKNTDESDYVRNALMPEIEKGFRENGYELIGWPEVGFIHFFSKAPIKSLADLKSRKIWLWQGDPMGEAFASAADIAPIPLSIVDVYTQLSAKHGSIDTVYNAPFGAMAMQWHTRLNYATNIPMTNALGAIVLDSRYFNKLPDDLQKLIRVSGKELGMRITMQGRADYQRSIEILKKSGMVFQWDWNESEWQELLGLRDSAAAKLAESGYIPQSYFDRSRHLLEQYRQAVVKK
ncbi:MAG: TRAP transporter substrate-binding protein DctP [Gammaproteobacteria bacterium]|nr:TRAP transporter substrate-binding protein DctP [Gammaproteobacteria bacterium]